jgi:hypothetical protein
MERGGNELSKMSPLHEKPIDFDASLLCQVKLEPNNCDDVTTFWNDTSQAAEIFGEQCDALLGISEIKSLHSLNESNTSEEYKSTSFLNILPLVSRLFICIKYSMFI